MSDLGVTVITGEGFTGTELNGDSVTATQQYLTIEFRSDNINTDTGYNGDITCAVPFAGGAGRQVYTVVNNRKAIVRTEAEIAERRAIAEENRIRSKQRRNKE